MRRFFFIVLSIILFSSCGHHDDVVTEPSDRTVLAYFLTYGLTSDLRNNVVSMFEGLQETKRPSTVLIFWDNKTSTLKYPCIIKLSSDGNGNVNKISKEDYEKQNSKFDYIISNAAIAKEYTDNPDAADKDVITSVIKDMVSLSPSKTYGLIFGSHATSWIPPTNKYGSRVFASAYGDGIGIPELNEALLGVFNSSKKFDFILMDACMMGSIEDAYELQNTCSYYIASPMEIPIVGFPYCDITPYLFSDNYRDYTQKVCELYAATSSWGNCIALDCSEITGFTTELKKFVDEYSPMDLSSVQYYNRNNKTKDLDVLGLSYDILDLVNKATNNNASLSLKNKLDRLIVGKAFSLSVASEFPSFKDVDTSSLCGLGMYVPVESRTVWNTYLKDELLWGDASGWSSYIERNNFPTYY